MISITDGETPWADDLGNALARYLMAAGLPDLSSVIDHLMCLHALEVQQPELFFMGATPEEKSERYSFELAATRSILTLELAELGHDMQAPDVNYIVPN